MPDWLLRAKIYAHFLFFSFYNYCYLTKEIKSEGKYWNSGCKSKEKTTNSDVNLVGWDPAKSKQSEGLWVALIQSSAVGYHPINHCLLDAFAISHSAEWWRNTNRLMACWAQASPVPVMWSWDRPLLPNYKPSSQLQTNFASLGGPLGTCLIVWMKDPTFEHSLPATAWLRKQSGSAGPRPHQSSSCVPSGLDQKRHVCQALIQCIKDLPDELIIIDPSFPFLLCDGEKWHIGRYCHNGIDPPLISTLPPT